MQRQPQSILCPAEGQLRQPPQRVLPADLARQIAPQFFQLLLNILPPQQGESVPAPRFCPGPLRVHGLQEGTAESPFPFFAIHSFHLPIRVHTRSLPAGKCCTKPCNTFKKNFKKTKNKPAAPAAGR